LEGRPKTMCEVSDHCQRYRPEGDKRPVRLVTEDEIRGTCHRLLWGGINTLTSYYAFQGLSDEQLRRINTEIGRCSTMLAGGHQVSDVAVLYPVESVWPNFEPSLYWSTRDTKALTVENVFNAVGSALYEADRDFRYVDARALREANVKDGAMRHGDLRWRVLVLPAADTLPLDAWKNVERFWRKGGAVIAVGARPANSESAWPSKRVQEIGNEVFGKGEGPSVVTNAEGGAGVLLPTGMVSLVPRMIDALLERDAACADAKAPVKITHRRVEDHDVYFAINDSAAAWSGDLCFCGSGAAEQWDPASGAMTPLKDAKKVAVQLGPYGAVLFRAKDIGEPRRLAGTVASNLALTCEPLPAAAKPTVGQGEFVRSSLSGDAAAGWCAAATLTKGQVDTHLFMSFDYGQPLALEQGVGLMVESTVPEGQQTTAEMLVMLHTKDGADYVAGSGRYLNVAGTARSYLMFNRFALAGWSNPSAGALDLAKVVTIRIGWGGYFGREGEKVTLTAKPAQRFTCGAK